MKTSTEFEELLDKALDDALANLSRTSGGNNPSKAAPKPNERGKVMRICPKVFRNNARQTRQTDIGPASNDSRRARVPVEFSGIVDHNSALLALAGAAASADCEPCLDEIAPELEGVGMTKADIRNAVESGRFPGAFPLLSAELIERAHASVHGDEPVCVEPEAECF